MQRLQKETTKITSEFTSPNSTIVYASRTTALCNVSDMIVQELLPSFLGREDGEKL